MTSLDQVMNSLKRKHSRRNAEYCLKGEVRALFPYLGYVLQSAKQTKYLLK